MVLPLVKKEASEVTLPVIELGTLQRAAWRQKKKAVSGCQTRICWLLPLLPCCHCRHSATILYLAIEGGGRGVRTWPTIRSEDARAKAQYFESV